MTPRRPPARRRSTSGGAAAVGGQPRRAGMERPPSQPGVGRHGPTAVVPPPPRTSRASLTHRTAWRGPRAAHSQSCWCHLQAALQDFWRCAYEATMTAEVAEAAVSAYTLDKFESRADVAARALLCASIRCVEHSPPFAQWKLPLCADGLWAGANIAWGPLVAAPQA